MVTWIHEKNPNFFMTTVCSVLVHGLNAGLFVVEYIIPGLYANPTLYLPAGWRMDVVDYFTHDEIVLSRPHSAVNLDLMKLREELEHALATVLRNIKNIQRISFDIGQTIVKIAYSATVPKRVTTTNGELVDCEKDALHMHCIQVRLDDFEAVLDYLAREGNIKYKDATFISTYNTSSYESMIQNKLGVLLWRIPIMESLVHGTNFLIRNIEDETFIYDHHNDQCKYEFMTVRPSDICPYLLVNVGTGISVFKVAGDNEYQRIGGSSLGGGAFFGLAQLLTDDNMERDLDELLHMAEDGDHRAIDTLVSDIYGDGFDVAGLSGDIIAGSFGKCTKRENADRIKSSPDFRKNAIRSLLLMISNSIGQLAVLYAQKESVQRIYFDGFLIRNHGIIMRTISYSIKFWSAGAQQAHFLRHEGYTSAIGAYLQGGRMFKIREEDIGVGAKAERLSWHEYYHGCSELGRFVPTAPLSAGFTAGALELEFTNMSLRPFYLLADEIIEYKPDAVNLNVDSKDREFWLKVMEDSLPGVIKKALESQILSKTAEVRANAFREDFKRQIGLIREKSFAYGSCTIRNLLDLREQLLNEYGFDDTYLSQKGIENEIALSQLKGVLETIDAVQSKSARLFFVSKGLLAGNVFDWGAQKVVEMMEAAGGLSFETAIETIPDRPWLEDGFDEFHNKVMKNPYNCAVIFVDNSGADVFLGVIPFARELLLHGTKVIIVSNLKPALNDLTHKEMMELIDTLKAIDGVLKEAIESGKLMFNHSGQSSPCLDLRKVHSELNADVIRNGVDLVVIEGMGRALHTNINAVFSCDSLKAAVIKTKWLADKMNGELFSVVFKFERGRGPALPADPKIREQMAKAETDD